MAGSRRGSGTSTLKLEHPADKLRKMGKRTTLPGAKPAKPTGPKPVRLTADQ